MEKVALQVCNEYKIDTVYSALKKCFSLLGGIDNFIKPHTTVLIKPDLFNETEPNLAKTTHPNIISALAQILHEAGANCFIADSPRGSFSQSKLDKAYSKTQMLEASNNGYASLSTNDYITTISNPNGECGKEFYIIDAINDADVIINVGKFRVDKNVGLIGCSQNLFGLTPGKIKDLVKNRCYTLNKYYNYIIDLNEAIGKKTVLNILDGIVSLEANNDPRILNTLLVGENAYAVDSVALDIISQEPNNSLLLREASRRQHFDFNVEILGGDIDPLKKTDYHYPTLIDEGNIKRGSAKKLQRAYNRFQKRAIICPKNCKGCKICTSICPMKAIQMHSSALGESYAKIDYSLCVNCLKCVDACPYKIITTKIPFKYKAIQDQLNKSLKK